jgi:hypothetical protein
MTKVTSETITNVDAECLMAEVRWIESRALRLHAQHDLEMLEAGASGTLQSIGRRTSAGRACLR